MLAPMEWYIISAILAAGLTLSSRLMLNQHNPQQVWAGLITGFFGLTFSMMFI
jgi:membrane-associated phospholipid phosphatase